MTRSHSLASFKKSSPRGRLGPCCTMTLKSGTKRWASRAQLPTTDVGATTRVGPVCSPRSFSTARRDSSWRVLPSPMSSASTAPMPLRDIQYSQSTPRRWYSRSSACTDAGISTRSGATLSTPPSSAVCQVLPVNSMGSWVMDSSASSRSSATVTCSCSSPPSLNSWRRRSTSAIRACQPGSSSCLAISAEAASCSSSFFLRAMAFSRSASM